MCDGLEDKGSPIISDIDRLEDNVYETAVGPCTEGIESGSDIKNEGQEMLVRMMVAFCPCSIIKLQAVCRGFIQRAKFWRTKHKKVSDHMMDLDMLVTFNVANIKVENAQEVLLYHANAKRTNAKKVTPAMVDGPPPDISKIPLPKVNRNGGAKASTGNGATKRDDAGLVIGQDAHGYNIYKKNMTEGNHERVSFLYQLAVFKAQPGINEMSAEFGPLPWGWGLMKLAFQAAHINEMMRKLPGPRPISSVQAFRQWLTCVGYDLSRYDGPWFFLQFSPAVWNSQGSRALEKSPTKMGPGVKRTRAQTGSIMAQADNSDDKTLLDRSVRVKEEQVPLTEWHSWVMDGLPQPRGPFAV
jgi:hypothetical protein